VLTNRLLIKKMQRRAFGDSAGLPAAGGGELFRAPAARACHHAAGSCISGHVTYLRFTTVTLLAVLASALPARAQTPLSVADAVARATSRNVDARIAEIAEREAARRVEQARAGLLPRVDFSESWQRGNQPVFVFGSLLAQRRFAAADFAIDALNHPSAVSNFRTSVTVEQPVFDAASRVAVRAARIGRETAGLGRVQTQHELAVRVTAAYGRVLNAAAAAVAAEAAVDAAAADRAIAADRRDAGLVTDADVLQLDMYLARTRAQQIRAEADERIARAELNAAMGEPLDAVFALERIAVLPRGAALDLPALESEALERRPDIQIAGLQQQLAAAGVAAARAAFLPQVSVQAGWELNGGGWSSRESSWAAGITARVNLFRGLADRARLAEARDQAARRALERERAETAARLDVRAAAAEVDAARARLAVGQAALAQAREARRIVRDRYENGLVDVAALLSAADAELQAATRQTAAEVDVVIAAASLNRAVGR